MMNSNLPRDTSRPTWFNPPTITVKVGKVIAIHGGRQRVDVVMLDGGFLRDVPILQDWATSVSGEVNIPAPTTSKVTPAERTYGKENLAVRVPPAVLDGTLQGQRDMWIGLLQIEGPAEGSSGYLGLGFFRDTDGEMMFPSDVLIEQLTDMKLARHESDFQITQDKYGTTSLQHPAGARIAIGDKHALDESTVKDNFLNLTGKDQNGKYQLRNNLTKQPVIVSELKGKSKVLQDSDGSVTVSNEAGASAVLNPDGSVIAKDAFGNEVDLNTNGIKLKSSVLVTISAPDVVLDLELFKTTLNTFFAQYDAHFHFLEEAPTTIPDTPSLVPPNPTPPVTP